MPAPLPITGDLFAGKYEIEHTLGEGGMCVVFAAKHRKLEERVAIKVLRPQFAAQPDVVERFMREGRAAIRIRSDHVVQILDVDVLPSGDPYLVMEHLVGNDLDALLLAHGPSPVDSAVDYILQASEA
ncbi:MAG: protein kinase, partial [Polyangiaceae bacterium]